MFQPMVGICIQYVSKQVGEGNECVKLSMTMIDMTRLKLLVGYKFNMKH